MRKEVDSTPIESSVAVLQTGIVAKVEFGWDTEYPGQV